jgi:DNA-binding CsgD family transcriptional regulator
VRPSGAATDPHSEGDVAVRHSTNPGSGSAAERTRLEPRIPEGLGAHSFAIGSDEYVVFCFPLELGDLNPNRWVLLTPTERHVATLVIRGQSTAAIARARGTSPRTIANQLAAIYAKLGVRSRRELRARSAGLERTT